MNYKSIGTSSLRPNLENFVASDIKDITYPAGPENSKSKYLICFFTGAGERYDWEFTTKTERDDAYSLLPHTPLKETKD